MGELVDGNSQKNPDITSKMELLNKERKWMKKLNATLNQTVPGRTANEYREQNKDKRKENSKQYYEKNKEHISQYREQKVQ